MDDRKVEISLHRANKLAVFYRDHDSCGTLLAAKIGLFVQLLRITCLLNFVLFNQNFYKIKCASSFANFQSSDHYEFL